MKKRTGITFLLVGLVLSMLVFAGTALSQDKPADNMKIFLDAIRADKKLIVAQNMQLTEAEAKAFWPVYDKYQDELFLLRARTLKMIQDYAASYENMTNAKAKQLLDESIRIEGLRMKLSKTYLPKFRAILPDKKVARYYQIENKANAVLYYEFAEKIPLVESK